MENMIKRIVDMDQKARAITEAARREKLDSEKEIAERAKQLREEYLDRARRRIQINGEMEKVIAEQKWARRQKFYSGQEKLLEEAYAAHCGEWVDAIVDNVLGD